MRLTDPRPAARRGGFTLIEIMMAILIISILTTLLLVGVQRAFATAKTVQARTEMAQLAAGINLFKQRFKLDFMPSHLDTTNADAIYRKMYPLSPSNALSNYLTARGSVAPAQAMVLDGEECLVFFLMGPPTRVDLPTGVTEFIGSGWPPGPTGALPTSGPTGNGMQIGTTDKPFFDFPASRLRVKSTAPTAAVLAAITTGDAALNAIFQPTPAERIMFKQYTDPWGTPYVYFSDTGVGNSYPATAANVPIASTQGVSPFMLSNSPRRYMNPSSFQLLSAGPDKLLATGGLYSPGTGLYAPSTPGYDDIANFKSSALGLNDE